MPHGERAVEVAGEGSPRWRGVRRRALARGHGGLCGRPKPRDAHGWHGPFQLAPGGAPVPEGELPGDAQQGYLRWPGSSAPVRSIIRASGTHSRQPRPARQAAWFDPPRR